MKLKFDKFDLQFFGDLLGSTPEYEYEKVPKRYDEPQYLKDIRSNVLGKINTGLQAFDPAVWDKAKGITNNALDTQNSLLSQIPTYLNQSNNALSSMQNLLQTGELPSGVTDKLNAGVHKELQSSMGNMLNGLASRGVVNSSITGQGISRLGQQAADAYNRNYLNAFNSVLSGNAQALQGSQNNTASLLSSLGAAAGLPSQAYEGATAGLMPAYNMWKALQDSYDRREDFDTVMTPKSSGGFCITGDSTITLKDGRNIPVSELLDDDEILCWDFDFGYHAYAPLTAFFKKHDDNPINVIRLHFEDGSNIGVIYEHLFFDLTLGKFIPVNADSLDFIGHDFAKINSQCQIVPVKVTSITLNETTHVAYSPHCKGYLNFFANGFISGTGGLLGLCNMFDFDTQNMRFDHFKKVHDLNFYGRLGYAALKDLVSEQFFIDNHLDTFAVAFGKNLISYQNFRDFISRFSHCFLSHFKEV